MTRISKELELSQTYTIITSHCIRTTAVSLLDECNFEARHIIRVSGHKSESKKLSLLIAEAFARLRLGNIGTLGKHWGSRETLGLSGKQNSLFPSAADIKCTL